MSPDSALILCFSSVTSCEGSVVYESMRGDEKGVGSDLFRASDETVAFRSVNPSEEDMAS